MVELLVAVALGLIVPALAVFLVALAYRVARGTTPPISRSARRVLAGTCLASALLGLFSASSAFANQTTSGPDIPTGLSVLNVFLVIGIWYMARSRQLAVAA